MKNPTVSSHRLAKALATHGIIAGRSGNIVTLTSARRSDIRAEILLPACFGLEAKAAVQLLAFAGVHYPSGGRKGATPAHANQPLLIPGQTGRRRPGPRAPVRVQHLEGGAPD